ncbi:ribonuclease E activity regulator RraA [Rubrobacter indicoceani]|uniref:ribonuclease E activity regulator RraA n=1 Tax=Rubrobacter indicoceani TaxID=2051957 RepID=UPI000E5AD343|nr:ribonuclease E activity regulator RraA [Rubrobacter indicoceani]
MDFYTADLSDEFTGRVEVCAPMFRSFGNRTHLSGSIFTVKAPDDNTLVRGALETLPEDAVLVVDGAASMNCALLGGDLARSAADRKLGGIVVNGCVRDLHEIEKLDIGVLALAAHPRKSKKEGRGEKNVTVNFGGIDFVPGHYLYADSDGVLVSKTKLL